jgi:predicted hotdog family 3-hydroxylacyl-ACP dehydratase
MSFPPIQDLLPHRPPMLLLDAVVGFDEESAQCSVTIHESSTFFDDGGVPAWVALEYCAQCVAAFAGLKAHHSGGEPRIGLLVAARELGRIRLIALERSSRAAVAASALPSHWRWPKRGTR